jgi:signal transduction histidine kinase
MAGLYAAASSFVPHGYCLAWDPPLLRLHVASDLAIALAYYSISICLMAFVLRRRDVIFSWVFWMFAAFILSCGTTHLFHIWTLWQPYYWVEGAFKAMTALVSLITAFVLWPLLPQVRQLPSPAALRRVNEALVDEVRQKEAALIALQHESEERRNTEALLVQSQKMEAIGQISGGMAHDFNNLLTVIQGNLELLEARLGGDPTLSRYVQRSLEAARQGGAMTHQLLTFARRQPLQQVVFDVNERLRGKSDLLAQTVGRSVRIEMDLLSGACSVEADPVQLESATLNLLINARDAMPKGGTVTIRTANISLDAEQAAAFRDAEPGDYVCISISDTGTGISPEILARVFEPFFTTKPVGSGTGLGLSQVYGFVRQSHGFVAIESEIGRGTTVSLHLRRAVAAANASE